ncbi:hypothetical protein Tco_0998018 [Tanacetum coccineum]
MKLTTSRMIDGSPCGRSDMVIKDLDLELKINAMLRDFLDPSRWKELSKETSSERYHIVPFGELNGVPVAFVAGSGVVSKSADSISVFHVGQ